MEQQGVSTPEHKPGRSRTLYKIYALTLIAQLKQFQDMMIHNKLKGGSVMRDFLFVVANRAFPDLELVFAP